MVTENYLYKIRFAVRTVSNDSNVLQELTDIIEECRAHMVTVAGVKKDVAEDETNPLVLGCVRSFARAKFSDDKDEKADNMADYRLQVDELRKAVTDEDT